MSVQHLVTNNLSLKDPKQKMEAGSPTMTSSSQPLIKQYITSGPFFGFIPILESVSPFWTSLVRAKAGRGVCV